MTIHNLFSTPIYKTNILNDLSNLQDVEQVIYENLNQAPNNVSSLEKHGGVSTYESNNQLHTVQGMDALSKLVLFHSRMYWKILDVDERLSPRIDQCWSNKHQGGSFTLQHSHSLMPMVGTFYLRAEKNSGDLILTNPAEYSLTNIPFSKNIEQKIETSIHINTGDLVLFPGYIRHKTGENFSNASRIVVSFNIGYCGKYLTSGVDYPDVRNLEYPTSEIQNLQNKILNLEFIIENLKGAMLNERKT